MRCSFCPSEQVVYQKQGRRFCKEHFLHYYFKKVKGFFYGHKLFNKKILVAVSGGKDSAALAGALAALKDTFHLELTLYYLDLGIINEYSKKGKNIVEQLANVLDLPFVVDDLKRYGKTIPALKETHPRVPICSICGTIKRYCINRYAFEHGFDFVALGHNETDELAFLYQNIKNQAFEYILRENPLLPSMPEKKLVGKIKPLYHLTEKENMIFVMLHQLPFYHDECPFAANNTQQKNKETFLQMMHHDSLFFHGLFQTIHTLKKELQEQFLQKEREQAIKACAICGYPTNQTICRFCRLMGYDKRL